MVECDAVKFVKHSYLKKCYTTGRLLARRQDLPNEAFATKQQVLAAIDAPEFDKQVFVAISYGWLTKDHPDPGNEHLKELMTVPSWLGRDLTARGVDIFYFWDFLSLPQEPRDAHQEKLFEMAKATMNSFYGATLKCRRRGFPCWYVFRLLNVPKYAQNDKTYTERGWCTFECAVSSSCNVYALDVNSTVGSLRSSIDAVPIHPDEFDGIIATKHWLRKTDLEKVKAGYRSVWNNYISKQSEIQRDRWREQDLVAFERVLPSFNNLRTLYLYAPSFDWNCAAAQRLRRAMERQGATMKNGAAQV